MFTNFWFIEFLNDGGRLWQELATTAAIADVLREKSGSIVNGLQTGPRPARSLHNGTTLA